MSTYKQLTQEKRYSIYQLKKIGFKQFEIVSEIGVNKSTISRELKRNAGGNGYRHLQAHSIAVERRSESAKAIKMTPVNTELTEENLLEQWSPEQVSGGCLESTSSH